MFRHVYCVSFLIFSTLFIAFESNAQEFSESKTANQADNSNKIIINKSNYSLSLTPYLLSYNLDGKIAFKRDGRNIPLELSFKDLSANPALGVESDVIFDEFRLYLNAEYQSFIKNSRADRLGVKYRVDLLTWFFDTAISTRWSKESDYLEWGLTGGLQTIFYDIDTTALNNNVQVSHDAIFVIPYIGVYGNFYITEKNEIYVKMDYSSVTDELEHYFNFMFQWRYSFTDRVQGMLGYKYRSLDYRPESITTDLEVSGALLGLRAVF